MPDDVDVFEGRKNTARSLSHASGACDIGPGIEPDFFLCRADQDTPFRGLPERDGGEGKHGTHPLRDK